MLRIIVEDDVDGTGCTTNIHAEGSAYLIAQQLHVVLKELCELCPPLVDELNNLMEEELK